MQLLKFLKQGKYPLLWELDLSSIVLILEMTIVDNELDDNCVKEMISFLRTKAKASSLHLVNFDNNGISPALLQEFKTVLAASYN